MCMCAGGWGWGGLKEVQQDKRGLETGFSQRVPGTEEKRGRERMSEVVRGEWRERAARDGTGAHTGGRGLASDKDAVRVEQVLNRST